MPDPNTAILVLSVVVFITLVFFAVLYMASRYKRCPSDKVLVISGRVGKGMSSRYMHGGGALILPLVQEYRYLSLTPLTINIPLQNALSLQNIRISVPSTFTVGISTHPETMANAAERLLNLSPAAIEGMAKEIIFGQLRLTVASLTIEQINQDRESFLESVRKNVEPELNKIGLYLINVNITDITDESEYIESIGKKAASEAVNRAKVDVAQQTKLGTIGEAENLAEAEKGKKAAMSSQRIYVQEREAEAVRGENAAQAVIAESNASLEVQKAIALQRGEVAQREAQKAIQDAEYLRRSAQLKAEEVAKQEIDKTKMEIEAEANAERVRREAKGDADAILMKYEAEAEGLQKLLEAKATGYQRLIESCNGDTQAAASLLMIERLSEIVAAQMDAISNLKIDKITVWDSGAGNGHTTADFISGFVKSLPPLQEVAAMAGLELPEYLGRMAETRKKNGDAPTVELTA
jgi:flotillin